MLKKEFSKVGREQAATKRKKWKKREKKKKAKGKNMVEPQMTSPYGWVPSHVGPVTDQRSPTSGVSPSIVHGSMVSGHPVFSGYWNIIGDFYSKLKNLLFFLLFPCILYTTGPNQRVKIYPPYPHKAVRSCTDTSDSPHTVIVAGNQKGVVNRGGSPEFDSTLFWLRFFFTLCDNP